MCANEFVSKGITAVALEGGESSMQRQHCS
jgi:hypothetical protein